MNALKPRIKTRIEPGKKIEEYTKPIYVGGLWRNMSDFSLETIYCLVFEFIPKIF